MAYFPQEVIDGVLEYCHIGYVNQIRALTWNATREATDLRALTGWYWSAKDGTKEQSGFKSRSAAIRDAHYTFIQGEKVPTIWEDDKQTSRRSSKSTRKAA